MQRVLTGNSDRPQREIGGLEAINCRRRLIRLCPNLQLIDQHAGSKVDSTITFPAIGGNHCTRHAIHHERTYPGTPAAPLTLCLGELQA